MKNPSPPASSAGNRLDRRRGSIFKRSADERIRDTGAESCVRPHVAVLRARHLEQAEEATDASLREWADLTGFDLLDHPFQTDFIAAPFADAASLEAPILRASRKVGFYVNLFFQAMCGWDSLHPGLLSKLREFDIVHTSETFHSFSWQALQAKRAHGCKLVTTVRENHPFVNERFQTMRDMKSAVLREADLHIATTECRRQRLLLEGAKPTQVQVIPRGVDVQRFTPLGGDGGVRARLGLADEEFVILGVVDSRWGQDVQNLVYAVKRLSEDPECSKQRIRLVLAGSDSEHMRLKRLAHRIGLQEILTVTAFKKENIARVYRAADAFAWVRAEQSGWREDSPYVLPEALASGLPVIATQSSSTAEVLGGGGVLVPPSDSLALSQAIKPLVLDAGYREQLSATGRQLAESRHDARCVARRIAVEYERLLER
jgi:glycosyltransferase involved in cell wall biosynthesis